MNDKEKSVLVIGASGFIGKAVVKELLSNDYQTECFLRKSSKLEKLNKYKDRLKYHFGDILDQSSLAAAMREDQIVINCSGLNSFWQRNNKDFEKINVEGIQNIAEAALEKKVSKLVEVSTIMAYGFPTVSPFNEDSEIGPHKSRYAESKFKGAVLLWDLREKKNLPIVIVYLAAVLGAGDDKDVMKIGRFLKEKVPVMINSKNKFTYLYINDAAKAIVKAANLKNNIGMKYLVGKHSLTTNQYFQIISDISGIPMPKYYMGKRLSLFLAFILTSWAKITGKPPLIPIELMRTVFHDSLIFNDNKAVEELKLEYTPIKVALEEEIKYIKEEMISNE